MNLSAPILTFTALVLAGGLMLQPALASGSWQRGGGRPPQRQAMRPPPRMEQSQPQQIQREQQFQRAPEPRAVEPQPLREPVRPPVNQYSPNDAARRAQQMNGGGRVLSVDPNGPGYRVKVLKEGEVRVITVPGQ